MTKAKKRTPSQKEETKERKETENQTERLKQPLDYLRIATGLSPN